MTELKTNSKRAQHFINEYVGSDATHLSDVYGKWSRGKEDAFCHNVRHMTIYLRCTDIRIISHNTHTFTLAGVLDRYNYKLLIVATRSNYYEIKIAQRLPNGYWRSLVTGELRHPAELSDLVD